MAKSIGKRQFQEAVGDFTDEFQRAPKRQVYLLGDNAGNISVTGQPGQVWARTPDGVVTRIARSTLASATPAGTPLFVDEQAGYNGLQSPQGVAVEGISNYNGQNFMGSYLGAAGQIAYADASGNATSEAGFTWSGIQLRLINDVSSSIRIDAYDDVNSPFIFMRRARGTQASHAATEADDILMALWGTGRATTDMVVTNKAAIEFAATETWSDSAMGTKINFYTTPNGSTTRTLMTTIEDDGLLQMHRGGAVNRNLASGSIAVPTGYSMVVSGYYNISGGASLNLEGDAELRIT